MTFRVLKDDKEREYKKGDLIGIPDKYSKLSKQLIKEGIIEALGVEEAQVAFDELRKAN